MVLHATQAAPPVPQAETDGAAHVVPWQHPDEQDSASQVQAPPTQCCPGAHAGEPPHLRTPLTHESAVREQSRQTPPPAPQADGVGLMQVEPWQQPEGQLAELQTHTPPAQTCPAPQAGDAPQRHCPLTQEFELLALQATHAEPPVPHADGVGLMQVEPWQHPAGQEDASHAHAPPTQC